MYKKSVPVLPPHKILKEYTIFSSKHKIYIYIYICRPVHIITVIKIYICRPVHIITLIKIYICRPIHIMTIIEIYICGTGVLTTLFFSQLYVHVSRILSKIQDLLTMRRRKKPFKWFSIKTPEKTEHSSCNYS